MYSFRYYFNPLLFTTDTKVWPSIPGKGSIWIWSHFWVPNFASFVWAEKSFLSHSQWIRMGILIWFMVGVKYYSQTWLLHTTRLLRYHGLQENWKRPRKFSKAVPKVESSLYQKNVGVDLLIYTYRTVYLHCVRSLL